MGRPKPTKSSQCREWISRIKDGAYTTDGKVIYCQPSITKLESQGLTLFEQLQTLTIAKTQLESAPGEVGEAIFRKSLMILKGILIFSGF